MFRRSKSPVADESAVVAKPGGVDDIAAAIEIALGRPPARPELDLNGVAATRAILEKLGAGEMSAQSRLLGR